MLPSPIRLSAWSIPFLLLTLAGCGDSGPKVVKVSGVLTHKGKPVTDAYINFLPEKGRQSWAETDEQGHFTIHYDRHQDGAVVGKHKVWLTPKPPRPKTRAEEEAVMAGRTLQMSKEMAALFSKYDGDNSKLTVEITKATNDLKIDLE